MQNCTLRLMEKLIYLLGETESGNVPRGRSDLRERLFSAASDLAAEGARVLIAERDHLGNVPSGARRQLRPHNSLER